MADTKFMSFAEATPSLEDSVLVANTANGVRRTKLGTIIDIIGAAALRLGISYNLDSTGYLCMGKLFGDIVLQWGDIPQVTLPPHTSSGQKFIAPAYTGVVPLYLTAQSFGDQQNVEIRFWNWDENGHGYNIFNNSENETTITCKYFAICRKKN